MKPQRVLIDVRKVMRPGDILLSDVGAHKMWIARHYNCYKPKTCLISNGFATMGFSLPAHCRPSSFRPISAYWSSPATAG